MANLLVARKPFLVCTIILAFSLGLTAQRGGAPGGGTRAGGTPSRFPDSPDKQKTQKNDNSPLTFKAKAQYVLVPVVVNDGKDQHISGLTKDDFTVFENGKEQPIATVEELKADRNSMTRLKTAQVSITPQAPNAAPVSIKAVTNELSGTQSQKRIVIIVLDRINTKYLDQHYASESLLKFLQSEMNADSLVELLSMNSRGIQVVHDFTTDPSVLLAAVKKATGQFGATENVDYNTINAAPDPSISPADPSAVQDTATRIDAMLAQGEAGYANIQQSNAFNETMECFGHIAEAFNGIPGRKSLVWLTGSFNFKMEDPGSEFPTYMDRTGFERTMKELADSNISIYPVDVRGLVNPGFIDASTNVRINPRNPAASINQMQKNQIDRHNDSIATLNEVAEMTGGRAFYNSNDIAGSIAKAQKDAANYYMLSYALDKSDTKPGWRKLKVSVRHNGAHVRARTGFYLTAATENPEVTKQRDMSNALSSPIDYTALVVRATIGNITKLKDGKREVEYLIVLPPGAATIDETDNNHLSMEFAYSVDDHQGNIAGRDGQNYEIRLKPSGVQMVREKGVTYMNVIKVAPGDYTVRFVVRDNLSGRAGSVQAPLKVE